MPEPGNVPLRPATAVARLARDNPSALTAELAELTPRQVVEIALRLPARERLEVLLHAPKPMRAVRALPDADLYLTARELGPADALPLLALASAAQLQHVLDLEAWRHDAFDPDRAGAWVALLLEAGEPVVVRFLQAADDDLLALLFQRWLQTRQLDGDEDPSVRGSGHTEAGDERGQLSPDGAHLFSPRIAEHGPAVRRIAAVFFHSQQERYFRTLQSALWELPSELEEQALRWRQSRLEEHGYLPFEDALTAYASPEPIRERAQPLSPEDRDGVAAPRTTLLQLAEGNLLARAAARVDEPARETVLHEIASLASRLVVADGADLGEPEAHRAALRRAGAYAGLGLQGRGARTEEAAARLLAEVPVLELFREGFARVAELRDRARRLTREGWPARNPRALELLDAPMRPRIQALLGPRPLYVPAPDEQEPAGLRDFRTQEEVEETRLSLDLAETLGRVLVDRLGLDLRAVLARPAATESGAPRLSTIWLTALAWQVTRAVLRGDPLPPDVAAAFLRAVRKGEGPAATERLVGLLEAELALSPREGAALRAFGRACLDRLAEDTGGLDPDRPLDPRTVATLMLEE
ncbi:MAG TPA: DUF6178 family protein [Candidatus Polarisedimenticolaceae bacterium]|nr:DUF6178 family protein [Candidatus Polarisedimenticolaceae bacterium]